MLAQITLLTATLISLTQAHSGGIGILGLPAGRFGGLAVRQARNDGHLEQHLNEARDEVACGTQGNLASCPAGQCCSQNGTCGTGPAYCDAPQCQYQYGPACDANVTPKGANTSSIPRPQLGSEPYSLTPILNCTKAKTVALTYDDGPYLYSLDLYTTLAKYNAKATFFITGNNMGKKPIDDKSTPWPQLLQYAYDTGHQIAQHTWSHPNLEHLTSPDRKSQLVKLEMALRNVLGFFPTYMRPPYQSCQIQSGCRADVQALGYHHVEENVFTEDFVNYNPDQYDLLIANFTQGISGVNASYNHIVYMHEYVKPTVYDATEYILKTLSKEGYSFVTVGECLGDPVENWYRDGISGNAHTPVKFGVDAPKAPLRIDESSSGGSGSTTTTGSGTSAGIGGSSDTSSGQSSDASQIKGLGYLSLFVVLALSVW